MKWWGVSCCINCGITSLSSFARDGCFNIICCVFRRRKARSFAAPSVVAINILTGTISILRHYYKFHLQGSSSFPYFQDLIRSPSMLALNRIRTKTALRPISVFHVCIPSKETLPLLTVNPFSLHFFTIRGDIPIQIYKLRLSQRSCSHIGGDKILFNITTQIRGCWRWMCRISFTIITCQYLFNWFSTIPAKCSCGSQQCRVPKKLP